jgi:putative oxidoreductase
MSDQFVAASAGASSGEQAMSRLADRLAALAPPAPALELSRTQAVSMPRTPAAAAALTTSAAIAARAAERARRSRSVIGVTVDSFVAACSFVPYALVALVLRLVCARIFFLDGQGRIDGLFVPLRWHEFAVSFVLPLQVKADAIAVFAAQSAPLPLSPLLAAYVVVAAEFILPICVVLGFATRFAALGLLIVTALLQVFVMPQALWSAHVYWASMLLVLLSLGAGPLSIDAVIRWIARR